MDEWEKEYGPIYKLQTLFWVVIILTDPDAVSAIIRKGKSYLIKSPTYSAMELATRPHLPNILTSPDNAYWKAVRQGVAPCFSATNLKQVCTLHWQCHVWRCYVGSCCSASFAHGMTWSSGVNMLILSLHVVCTYML